MSADLFAAFGPYVPSGEASKKECKGHASLDTPPTVLKPGVEMMDIEKEPHLYQKPSRPKQEDNQRLWRLGDGDTDVLFDATEDAPQADDDFGDFEDANATEENRPASSATVQPTQEDIESQMRSNMPKHDLLGMDEEQNFTTGRMRIPSLSYTSTVDLFASGADGACSTTIAEDDWGDFSAPTISEGAPPARGTSIPPLHIPTQGSEVEQESTEEDWDVFEDRETEAVAAHPAVVSQLNPPPKSNRPSRRTDTQTAEAIRPSNVPPPAILLQILPGVFDELRQAMTQQVRQNPPLSTNLSQRDTALRTIQAFTVAARIIAGRALRWKRDANLAQSMRIGPAASAGGGRGMKLAAIDKSEALKEEKEAADVVGAWEKNAHTFNSTVSKAGIQRPLMALYLSVRPRLANGLAGLKASHACALCGINRDERVPQVEAHVEDSFGEYWIEHWGHRDCRDFWTTYKGRLHQR